MDTFRKEDSDAHKLNIWNTLLFTLVSIMLGTYAYSCTDGKDGSGGWGWDWFHRSDPLILNYLKLIGCGALTAVIGLVALVIIIGVFYLIFMAFESMKSRGESKSAVGKTVSAIKNKYCPRIDWSSITKK
jgi:hypothetical protein